jgi:hypothetical protein
LLFGGAPSKAPLAAGVVIERTLFIEVWGLSRTVVD